MDRPSTQKTSKETLNLNYILAQMDLIYTEHSIQQKNTHSSQGHAGHSPREVSLNLAQPAFHR